MKVVTDDTIAEIAKIINENGGRLYLVGGAVRDKILGIENHDYDYCVVGISHDDFIKLFPNAHVRGKAFEVFDMCNAEFALARTEKKNGKGHKNFEVQTGKNITIIEDLKRRDLTINSIAEDVLTGEIIDPYCGKEDIKKGIIRATSNSFAEDPLRVYRAARFACKFNFEIEKNTIKLMKSLRDELKDLSGERVFDELRKVLKYEKPSIFFEQLKKAEVLDIHFPEVYKLIGALQPEKYHPEGDAYNHTMLALDMSAKLTSNEKLRFAVLVHDLGKGITPKEMYPHHHGHDKNGPAEVTKLVNRLKMPKEWAEYGKVSAKEHMKAGIFYKMTPGKQVEFIERISKTRIGLDGLEIVVESDRNCRGRERESIKFADLGKKVLESVTGELIKEKYDIKDEKYFKQVLHQERVNVLKEELNKK